MKVDILGARLSAAPEGTLVKINDACRNRESPHE